MAYKVIILYRLYMPPYFLGTFTEYPYKYPLINSLILSESGFIRGYSFLSDFRFRTCFVLSVFADLSAALQRIDFRG